MSLIILLSWPTFVAYNILLMINAYIWMTFSYVVIVGMIEYWINNYYAIISDTLVVHPFSLSWFDSNKELVSNNLERGVLGV